MQMQAVRFLRAMAPHGVGDTRALPADVADRLAAEGAVELGSFGEAPHATDRGFIAYKTQSPKVVRQR